MNPEPSPVPKSSYRSAEEVHATLSAPPFVQPGPPSTLLLPGELLASRFRIVRHLGSGGMGDVYQAEDTWLRSGRIAIKTIKAKIADDPTLLSRFKEEVLLARRISNPNVCRIHELYLAPDDSGRGVPIHTFLTMEFLEGVTLAERIAASGPIDPAQALDIATQLCSALETIHAAGVVHRDLKPRNIMLVPHPGTERLVVMDFGLARAVQIDAWDETALTTPGIIMGTPPYMAPELFHGAEATPVTDIYALGAVLYEVLTGRHPFAAKTGSAREIARGRPPAPSTLRPGIPPCWDRVVGACLDPEPGRRLQSPAEVARALLRPRGIFVALAAASANNRRLRTASLAGAGCLLAVLLVLIIPGIVKDHQVKAFARAVASHTPVLVADFNTQGDSSLDAIARDLVLQSLSQSHQIAVVPRLTALEGLRRLTPSAQAIDSTLAAKLCLREGYAGFVTGQIAQQGAQRILILKLWRPSGSRPLFIEQEKIPDPQHLYAAVDSAVLRLRQDAGESLADARQASRPLAEVTTSSLEALRRYSKAVDLYGAGEYARASALAQDAINLDPSFAMAHLLVAQCDEANGDEKHSQQEYDRARAGLDRVGERERHLILAAFYASRLMNEKAADEYQHLLDLYPDDLDALKGFAESSYWAGRTPEALSAQQRALELNSSDPAAYEASMALLIRADQFSEALKTYRKAAAFQLHSDRIDFLAGIASWGNGDLKSARNVFQNLSQGNNELSKVLGLLSLGRLLAYQGETADALAILRTGSQIASRPGWEYLAPVFQYNIAKTALLEASASQARLECSRYQESARSAPTAVNLQRAISLSVSVGDLPTAKRCQELLKRKTQPDLDAFTQTEILTAEGDVELAKGSAASAVQLQKQALASLKREEPYLSLAHACEKLGDVSCAIDAYRGYLAMKGDILRDDAATDYILAQLALANLYCRNGEEQQAHLLYSSVSSVRSSGSSGSRLFSNLPANESCPGKPGT